MHVCAVELRIYKLNMVKCAIDLTFWLNSGTNANYSCGEFTKREKKTFYALKEIILRMKRNLFAHCQCLSITFFFARTRFFFFFCIYFARTSKHSRVGCWLYKSFALHAKSIFILELLVFLVFSAFTTLQIITAFVVSFNFLIAIKTHFEIKSGKQAEIKKIYNYTKYPLQNSLNRNEYR